MHLFFKRKHSAKNLKRTWFDGLNGRLVEFSYIFKHDPWIVFANSKILKRNLIDLFVGLKYDTQTLQNYFYFFIIEHSSNECMNGLQY